MDPIKVHRHECTAKDWFVNSYLVETPDGVVLIDGGLALSTSRAIRRRLEEEIRKPLRAVLLTHGHPDHYMGVAEILGGREVPILATPPAIEQARARDAAEAPVLAGFFGADFPTRRVLPDTPVSGGEVRVFDGVPFRLLDLGPGESDADAAWVVGDGEGAELFVGDLIYNHMHAFFMDGHATAWLAQLDRVLALCRPTTRLHPGHGDSCGLEGLLWQRGYLQSFLLLLRQLTAGEATLTPEKAAVLAERMNAYVGSDKLLYLLQFGMEQTISRLRASQAI